MPLYQTLLHIVLKSLLSKESLILLALVITYLIWRKIENYNKRARSSNRDRINNITEALSDSKILNDAYLLEQKFLDRYGVLLDFKEIRYFLKQSNPSEQLTLYIRARRFVCFNQTHHHLILKHKWMSPTKLTWIFTATVLLFTILVTFALAFLWLSLSELLIQGDNTAIAVFSILSFFCFLYASMFFEICMSAEMSKKMLIQVNLSGQHKSMDRR